MEGVPGEAGDRVLSSGLGRGTWAGRFGLGVGPWRMMGRWGRGSLGVSVFHGVPVDQLASSREGIGTDQEALETLEPRSSKGWRWKPWK